MSNNLFICERCGDIVPGAVIDKMGDNCLHCESGKYTIDSGRSLTEWYAEYEKTHPYIEPQKITTEHIYRHLRSSFLIGKTSYSPALRAHV